MLTDELGEEELLTGQGPREMTGGRSLGEAVSLGPKCSQRY